MEFLNWEKGNWEEGNWEKGNCQKRRRLKERSTYFLIQSFNENN
ncbi:hypothetical protein [Microcoleus sp. S36b_A2]